MRTPTLFPFSLTVYQKAVQLHEKHHFLIRKEIRESRHLEIENNHRQRTLLAHLKSDGHMLEQKHPQTLQHDRQAEQEWVPNAYD